MKSLCVFDLDGTLVNSLADLAASTNAALQKHGFPQHPVPEYRYMVGDGVNVLVRRALGEAANPENEAAVLAGFNGYYAAHYADETRPYAGVDRMLSALAERRVRCAVLSNKPDGFAREIVRGMFPAVDFAWVQGKAEGFPRKPDPTALLRILAELGAGKSDTLYIGDSNVDIETGKNAGVDTCGVTWGFRGRRELEEAGAGHVVDRPDEILLLL